MAQKVDGCTSVKVERRPRVIKVVITFDAELETVGYEQFVGALYKSGDQQLMVLAEAIEKDDPES